MINLRLGYPLRFRGTRIPVGDGDAEPRSPDNDRAAGIRNSDQAEVVNDVRAVAIMSYRCGASAYADGGDRRVYCSCTLMAKFPANEAKRPLNQRTGHLTTIRTGIVDKLIDNKCAARTNINRGFVNQEQLDSSAVGGLNSLVVEDCRSDAKNLGAAPWRGPLRKRIDCGSFSNFLGDGRN